MVVWKKKDIPFDSPPIRFYGHLEAPFALNQEEWANTVAEDRAHELQQIRRRPHITVHGAQPPQKIYVAGNVRKAPDHVVDHRDQALEVAAHADLHIWRVWPGVLGIIIPGMETRPREIYTHDLTALDPWC